MNAYFKYKTGYAGNHITKYCMLTDEQLVTINPFANTIKHSLTKIKKQLENDTNRE